VPKSPLAIIFITVFIDLLGFGMVIPFLPLYAEHLGGTPFVAALLGTAYAAMQFIFAPIWGRLSDRVGRRPIIIGTLLVNAGAYLFLGLAGSVAALFAARLLAGIASGNIPTAQAYIADSTPPESRAHGMGLIGAAFGMGFVLGPAISGILLWRWHDPAIPAQLTAALAAANCLWAYFSLPESLKPDQTGGGARPLGRIQRMALALRTPGLAPLFALLFIIRFAFSALEWTFPIFLKRQFGFSFLHIGLLLAYTGVLMAITQGLLVGRLAPVLGERRMVALGTLVMAVGFALVPFAPGLRGLLALAALLAVGAGLTNPSLTSLISQTGATDTQGGVFGVGQSLSSLAMILGPAWGGFSFDQFGAWVPYTSSGVLMGTACLASLVAIRRRLHAARAKAD
jgi:MFS family permease